MANSKILRFFKIVNTFLLLIFLMVVALISLSASNVSFLFFGIVYILLIFTFSYSAPANQQKAFRNIVFLFLSIYSLYTIASFFILFNNPTSDFLSDKDEAGLYSKILNLSQFSFNEIWNLSFNDFKYSGLPLFWAYSSSLQKVSGLDLYYGALFQKLNIAFISSFIPGMVYLMLNRINENQKAIKWAIIYGLFSFTFFYSGLLLRDIHIAVIYSIGIYITLGNNGNLLKKIVTLSVLGVIAYFIRMESGVFFLVTFIFISTYKKQGKSKWLLYMAAIPVMGAVFLLLNGLDSIYHMAISTIQGYTERAMERAGQDSLGIMLRTLPIPLNFVSMTAFGQITPFPPWSVFENETMKNLFILPRIVSAVFWFLVWFHIISNFNRLKSFLKKYRYHVIVVLAYLVLISISQPYERRLMAVYPFIFIGFVSISKIKLKKSIIYSFFFYLILIFLYLLLKI